MDLARAVRQRWPGVAIVLVSGYSEALSGVEPALRAEVLAKPYCSTSSARRWSAP